MRGKRKHGKALWVQAFKKKRPNPKSERLRRYLEQRIDFLAKHSFCKNCHTRRATEVHHVRGRAASLLLDERGWIALCSGCHRMAHWNISVAREAGLICQRGLWGVPFDKR